MSPMSVTTIHQRLANDLDCFLSNLTQPDCPTNYEKLNQLADAVYGANCAANPELRRTLNLIFCVHSLNANEGDASQLTDYLKRLLNEDVNVIQSLGDVINWVGETLAEEYKFKNNLINGLTEQRENLSLPPPLIL